jgi:hypothetical protein
MTQSLRPMTAPTLALELRETIARWFSSRDTHAMQSSELILSALADLVAEQVSANPTPETQDAALKRFNREFLRIYAAVIRLRLGGIPVTIVKQ